MHYNFRARSNNRQSDSSKTAGSGTEENGNDDHQVTNNHAHNNSNKQHEEKYITYKLIQGGADYNFTFDPNRNPCKGDPNRTILPILHEKGVTDFRAVIETNLNIAYIGDSVGMQFSQSFQDAAGATSAQVIRYAWGWWHKFSHIAKVRGGGTVAGMRLTGPFLKDLKDCPEKATPRGGGGWLEYDLREMKRLLHQWRNVTSLRNAYAKHNNKGMSCAGNERSIGEGGTASRKFADEECKEEDFDVLVYQLPAGWMHTPNQLLNESMSVDIINRTVFDAITYFAPKIIILQTIPIINNVLSVEEYIAVNRNIMDFVRDFRKQQSEGVTLLVMDLGALSTSLLIQNAMHIHALTNGTIAGVTNSYGETSLEALTKKMCDADFSFLSKENYSNSSFVDAMRRLLYQRLHTENKRQHWSSIISHTCGEFIEPRTTTECSKGNEFTFDGQHWCMDIIGGRIDGVVACLLECSITKTRFLMHNDDPTERFLEECERNCNSQFMSLSPIPSL
jgi:hypothetical protein